MTDAPPPMIGVLAAALVLALALRLAPCATTPARDPSGAPTGRPPRAWFARRSTRRPPADDAVAAWCQRVAAGVRSGSSLTWAVLGADVPGTGPAPFPDVVHAIRRGRPLGDTFRDAEGDPSTPTGLAAPVVATCAELGGPSAGALDRVAAVLHARSEERAERRAASAQARLSSSVLTIIPLGVLAFFVLNEPSIRAILTTPAGLVCLVTGGALDLLGWWWMRRLMGAVS